MYGNGSFNPHSHSEIFFTNENKYTGIKYKLTEKETYIDLHMDELSTELEAINTEIQSIQSLIDDAISSVFDWGSG